MPTSYSFGKPLFAAIGALFLSVPALAAVHPAGSGSVPPDSFIRYHVSTVQALSQEVTLDPAVRGRLARHFHVTEAQITTYVRQNLVLTHLSRSGVYRVACVGRGGREYWITARLPARTPLFASRATGRPVLKLACGNPMVSDLPTVSLLSPPVAAPAPAQESALAMPTVTPAVVKPGLVPGDTPATDLTVADAVAPLVVEVSPSLQDLVVPATGDVGHAFNFLGPVLATGLALAVSSSGSGGSTAGGGSPVPAVPEATTTTSFGLLLMLGFGGLVVAKKRKQSV